ncbi:unnamed protein product [Cuscuta epithymum]|uniref:Replication factor A C-terminal domain-containing protein n=1 Tax=Cuscuta epithymum TaxID=186058 RepID=A0AAV0D4P7_9ASTE|nr:unnamed protein product [Cuscuta epithymum]
MVQDKVYNDALSIIAHPLLQPQCTLSGLENNLLQVTVVWVLGKFSLPDTTQECFYIGCNYCNRRVYGTEGITFQCLFCGQKQGTTVKRFRLDADLHDGTTSIPVTLFTTDILTLLKYTCTDPDTAIDLEAFNTKLQTLDIVAGIKHSKPNEEGTQVNSYTVVLVSQKLTTPNVSLPVTQPPPLTTCETSSQAKRTLNFKSGSDLPPDSPTTSNLSVHSETETEEQLGKLRGKKPKTITL